ncbi:hypothetical protein K2173_021128 [Erythroxylum novogranatense]|uniref:Uncharacterized protein n=1 Tax=Erythroxylum novogranatense TaxID=1862640 RepID=A0AAV8TPQ8_9ROSI|nr:hypothetical protein K2173_021128 [Erythroxylum novogranatense]
MIHILLYMFRLMNKYHTGAKKLIQSKILSDSFVAFNKPGDGKRFIRVLVKERQDLAERVMLTQLHLYGKWVKKRDHAEIYNEISNENLALMREWLMETVIWPSDDTNTEKIG